MTQFNYPPEPFKPIGKPIPTPGIPLGPQPVKSLWFAHDPAIYKDPVSGKYYLYCTNAICYESEDLISWRCLGKIIDKPPVESMEWVGGDAIWAPDIVKVGDEYRIYGSNSSLGVQQSCIFLATSNKPEGPFEPKGCVLKTSNKLPVNGIDANIVEEQETGQQYLVYGSFWDGCYMLKLDKETGYAAEEGVGVQIACRPWWTDRAIEGPYIRYNSATGYYYLFVSYGLLTADYNIRVGRSKHITGPYYDHNGRPMTDMDDMTAETGYLLHAGYQFDTAQAWMAPGHNSVLEDDDGKWYVIHHIRQKNFHGDEISTMHCHQMLWTEDGWPFINPCEYAGESVASDFTMEDIAGSYDRIKLKPLMQQGITTSTAMDLHPNGWLKMNCINGKWSVIDGNTVKLEFANIVETCKVLPSWDYDTWRPCLALTGVDQHHIGVWAKKR